MVKFDCSFKEQENKFNLDLNKSCASFGIKFGIVNEIEVEKDIELYDGATTIIPEAHEEQVLQTANKKVLENIIVKKVPYFQTSNQTGETVYIASEVF